MHYTYNMLTIWWLSSTCVISKYILLIRWLYLVYLLLSYMILIVRHKASYRQHPVQRIIAKSERNILLLRVNEWLQRNILLKWLQKWKLFIFDLGNQLLNFFFHRNGKVTENFSQWVMQSFAVCTTIWPTRLSRLEGNSLLKTSTQLYQTYHLLIGGNVVMRSPLHIFSFRGTFRWSLQPRLLFMWALFRSFAY